MRVLDSGQVAEQHPMRVQGTLGLARRARGVDEDGRLFRVSVHRLEAIRCALDGSVQIDGPIRGTVGAEDQLQCRQPVAQPPDLRGTFGVGDDGAGFAVLQAELERLLAEEREERDRDEAGFVRGYVDDGRFVPLGQQDGDAVASLDALGAKQVGEPVREADDVPETEGRHLAGGVDFDEGGVVASRRVAVGDVHADVEALRDRPAEIGRTWHAVQSTSRRPQRTTRAPLRRFAPPPSSLAGARPASAPRARRVARRGTARRGH